MSESVLAEVIALLVDDFHGPAAQHIGRAHDQRIPDLVGARDRVLLGALGGMPTPSALIKLDAPALADNGAVVPITVSSALPGTREILLLVDGNPQPVAARFTIPPGTEPFVATRIRMAGNGTVYAVVRTDDGLHAAARAIEVTVGGCG